MNHKHRKVLHALFAHPVPANISLREVESVFRELGAELEERHNSRVAVTLAGHTVLFHHAQHSLPKQEVQQIRKFLETCDIDPGRDYPI